MSNQNLHGQPNLYGQQNPMELIERYFKLLWSKRFIILIITLGISVIWFFTSKVVLEKRKKYSASAIIKFDDPRMSRGRSAVTDFNIEATEGKVAILSTKSFLNSVIDSLDLNLVLLTRDINRFDLFKEIHIYEDAKYGLYKFMNMEDSLRIFYTNKANGIEDIQIGSMNKPDGSDVWLYSNGIDLTLDGVIMAAHDEIDILYESKVYTVNSLIANLEGSLDRSGMIFTITYAAKHPEVAAKITNTIANMYIDRLLEFNRFRTSSVLKTLGEQLSVARKELDQSEEVLRKFREGNPYLFLSSAGNDIVTQLATSESEMSNVQGSINQLSKLLEANDSGDFDRRNLVFFEINSFLSAHQLPGSSRFTQQYNELLNERSRLLADDYSKDHPQVLEIESRLTNLQSEIRGRATEYLQQLKDSKGNLQSQIYRKRGNIRKLPKGEIQLAELQRDQEVKQRIYSSILVRYNEAKVSDAAVIPDAFLIEEATAPIVSSNLMDQLIQLGIGPFIGIVFSIAIFVVLDFLDNTARRVDDVESKLNLSVLATIPVIADEKEVPDEISLQGQLDSKLITSDYAPSIASEKVRLVRTKLSLGANGDKNAVIVASLSPNEGKSLFTSNLGITFAQQKIKTLVIDCDLRRGVLHKSFNCSKKPGIADFLSRNGRITYNEFSKVVQQTHVPNLYLVSSGIQVPNPSELLGSNRMRELLEVLKNEFGMIIIDTPPMEFMPEVLILNSFIHNIVLVVRYGRTNLHKLRNKMTEYSNIKKDFCGVVLNASTESHSKDYHSYSYYHY